MRLISIEWLTVILITVLMRASTQTLAGCFRAAHHCPSFYENAFIAVVNKFIGQNENQTTITDLCKEMKLCSTPYSAVYIKKRLQELLVNRVIISNVQGKANIVTFNETSASILQAYHEKCKTP